MRLASPRRWRVLSLLLLVVSPGAGGSVLPLLHPCPVDSPWLLHQPAAGSHASHHGRAPKAEHHDRSCHCVGSCTVAAAPGPPAGALTTAALPPAAAQQWSVQDAAPLAPRASRLLPPSTAPPRA